MEKLTVACVETGDYLGCGQRYVSNLRAMVARHLSLPHQFVCLTDAPARHPGVGTVRLEAGLRGWWNKLELFKPGQFEGRVLYFDLDTVLVGSIDKLAGTKGIIHLKDWGWTKNDYGSGVMCWDAGEHAYAWAAYTHDVPHLFTGDQDWLTSVGGWPALPRPPLLCSFKYHCQDGPPPGAAVVCFHGPRKPHNQNTGRFAWVGEAWAGGTN